MDTDKVNEIRKTIKALAGNTIFFVRFRKRTTGEMRDMTCRLGSTVTKGVNGEGANYDALEKGLLRVYDMTKDGWRCVPLDAIERIQIRGESYDVASV